MREGGGVHNMLFIAKVVAVRALCAGQRVVLIVIKVVAKRIWIEDTQGHPWEFAMIIVCKI